MSRTCGAQRFDSYYLKNISFELMSQRHLCVCVSVRCDLSRQTKDNIGLSGGGQKVSQCREKYKQWVENLIKLASLQTSFVTMDEALKVGCCMREEPNARQC